MKSDVELLKDAYIALMVQDPVAGDGKKYPFIAAIEERLAAYGELTDAKQQIARELENEKNID